MSWVNTILVGDAIERLRELPDECVNTVVTSPPYWGLRDYGVAGQIGLEATPGEYVAKIVSVFREVRRVMRTDATLWLNLGDSYAGSGRGRNGDGTCHVDPNTKQATNRGSHAGVLQKRDMHDASVESGVIGRNWVSPPPGLKCKDLVGVPWRVAFALQADGWWLRSDIIWAKPNPMPESVTDRPTKAHEYIFLLSKSETYHYDGDAIRERAIGDPGGNIVPTKGAGDPMMRTRNGLHLAQARAREAGGFEHRNRRTVWTVTTAQFPEAHFATFPETLVQPCILAGSPAGGVVLDPFMGSGTTALVALKAARRFVGVELNPQYAEMARKRIEPELTQLQLSPIPSLDQPK